MPRTCLIAAHDPWFIQLLRIYTEESGFRVVQAYEGQDVLPIMRHENPAALLLQVDLPGQVKAGELLGLLRADPAFCHIPVLLFSWENNAGDSFADLTDETTAYLQEPVTYEAFSEALHSAGICS
jgi:CheY-like chemotaxis protein